MKIKDTITETEKSIREVYELSDSEMTEDKYRDAIKFNSEIDMPDDDEMENDDALLSLEGQWEKYPKMVVLELCTMLRAMRIDYFQALQELEDIKQTKRGKFS
jgi:hypothetical protein